MIQYDLREELNSLRNEISKLSSDISGMSRKLVDSSRNAARATGDKIRERPKTSAATLLAVLLIGALVGIFLYRE